MSALPFISVVMATYNRADVLARTLAAYAAQNYPAGRLQLLVVDDGSADTTPQVLAEAAQKYPQLLLQAHRQENAGQGQARNRALHHLHADTDIVLFTGDDIIPAGDDFLQQHAEGHLRHCSPTAAVLGSTVWHPGVPHTAYMRYLDMSGQQFGTEKHPLLRLLRGERQQTTGDRVFDFWHFYTSNVSVKRAVLDGVFFHHGFKGWGWEDTEYALQLHEKLAPLGGLRLHYVPAARALHHHSLNEADYLPRTPAYVRNARLMEQLHPGVRVLPRGMKKLLMQVGCSWASPLRWGLLGANWRYYARAKTALLAEMARSEKQPLPHRP